jgi:hypothetical protein
MSVHDGRGRLKHRLKMTGKNIILEINLETVGGRIYNRRGGI